MNNGSYAILGGVAKSVINGDGVWVYNAYPWQSNGATNPQNEQNGYIGNPIQLQTNQVISSSNQPTWYIQVEFSMVNLDNFRGNVDLTYT